QDPAKRRELVERRQALLNDLGNAAAKIAARQVQRLERIQARLPADAALLTWIDLEGHPRAADPNGEHWVCLLRKTGAPGCVRMPGTGTDHRWTEDDEKLAGRVRRELTVPRSATASPAKDLGRRLAAQRLGPIESMLESQKDLPAVKRLIVLPS